MMFKGKKNVVFYDISSMLSFAHSWSYYIGYALKWHQLSYSLFEVEYVLVSIIKD